MKSLPEINNTPWAEMHVSEQVAWLGFNVLMDASPPSAAATLTHDFVALCETTLEESVLNSYVERLTGEVSKLAYEGKTEAQMSEPETAEEFYRLLVLAGKEFRAKVLHDTIRNR